MITYIFIIAILGIALYYTTKGHYIFSIFMAIASAYETSLLLLLQHSDIIGDTEGGGLWHFIERNMLLASDPNSTANTQMFIGLYFFITIATYSIANSLSPLKTNKSPSVPTQISINQYLPLFFLLFALGSISTITGAATSRLNVYIKESDSGSPLLAALHWGQALLVIAPILIIKYKGIASPLRKVIIYMSILSLPIITQAILAGRRQFLAPSIIAIVLLLLYNNKIKNKLRWSILIASTVIALWSVQFALRVSLNGSGESSDITNITLLALFAEFVAVASTTHNAINNITSSEATFGLHSLFVALDSIPIIRLGTNSVEALGITLWDRYDEIAPFGGFSVLADAWLSFNAAGIFILSIVTGTVLHRAHILAKRFATSSQLPNFRDLYLFSLTCTLLAMYRNGLTQMLAIIVGFSSLYILFTWLPSRFIKARRKHD